MITEDDLNNLLDAMRMDSQGSAFEYMEKNMLDPRELAQFTINQGLRWADDMLVRDTPIERGLGQAYMDGMLFGIYFRSMQSGTPKSSTPSEHD